MSLRFTLHGSDWSFPGALLGNEEWWDAIVTIRGRELWLHRGGDGRRSSQLSQNHAQT